MISKFLNYLKSPKNAAKVVLAHCSFLPDKVCVRWQYKLNMGLSINLDEPTLLTEKINWLKLYYHNPKLHEYVDKYEVGNYVSKKIGAEYVIPCIGVWDDVDSIDLSTLPDQFVLKCTHDSGSVVICRDKNSFDWEKARIWLSKRMNYNYFATKREWAYKDVKPRIIAEPFIPGLGTADSVEYKLTVYNGKVHFITVCTGIAHASYSDRFNDHFTPEWERLPFYVNYKPTGKDIKKPPFMDEMVRMSEILADDLPQVRVDWYVVNNKMIFGEMTFYTWAGYMHFVPNEWNKTLGSWLVLPEKKV